jgi:hypothetical protein
MATPSSVAVTPGSGDLVAAFQITESTQTKLLQRMTLSDSAGNELTPAGGNPIGQVLGTTNKVVQQPTIGTSSYATFKVMGGLLTFSNALPANSPYGAILQSITIKFRASLQTSGFWVALFNTNSLTWTPADGVLAAINTNDSQYLLGMYHLYANYSSALGTHTIYCLDGIGKALQGASSTLYAVVVPDAATVAAASTTDMIVELGLMWG